MWNILRSKKENCQELIEFSFCAIRVLQFRPPERNWTNSATKSGKKKKKNPKNLQLAHITDNLSVNTKRDNHAFCNHCIYFGFVFLLFARQEEWQMAIPPQRPFSQSFCHRCGQLQCNSRYDILMIIFAFLSSDYKTAAANSESKKHPKYIVNFFVVLKWSIFTSFWLLTLRSKLSKGLALGKVLIADTCSFNAVWLTNE